LGHEVSATAGPAGRNDVRARVYPDDLDPAWLPDGALPEHGVLPGLAIGDSVRDLPPHVYG